MGLSISNPSATLTSKLAVTKSNTAGEASLGSAAVTGATTATASAYGQISASLGADTLVTSVTVVTNAGALSASVITYVEIAYGAAASETVVAAVPIQPLNGATVRAGVGRLTYPVRIASGQRLAVRITAGDTSLNTNTVTIAAYGATYTNVEGN